MIAKNALLYQRRKLRLQNLGKRNASLLRPQFRTLCSNNKVMIEVIVIIHSSKHRTNCHFCEHCLYMYYQSQKIHPFVTKPSAHKMNFPRCCLSKKISSSKRHTHMPRPILAFHESKITIFPKKKPFVSYTHQRRVLSSKSRAKQPKDIC